MFNIKIFIVFGFVGEENEAKLWWLHWRKAKEYITKVLRDNCNVKATWALSCSLYPSLFRSLYRFISVSTSITSKRWRRDSSSIGRSRCRSHSESDVLLIDGQKRRIILRSSWTVCLRSTSMASSSTGRARAR